MTVSRQQIEDSAARMRVAASQSYTAFEAAKSEHAALVAAYNASQPERRIAVTGNTYPHRDALKRMGLRWDAYARAWVGMVRGDVSLPRGCQETDYAAAALRSMDHADSLV